MQLSKILFPTDFSPASDEALRYATALARDTGARLIIAHIEEPMVPFGGGEVYLPAPQVNNPELGRMLTAVAPADPRVPFEHRLLLGDPATEIVRLADEEQVDLIVMGKHGKTGLLRLLMGSVAEAVVRRALCPVLTLRRRKDGEE